MTPAQRTEAQRLKDYLQEAATLLKLPTNLDPRGYQGDDWKEVWRRCAKARELPERYNTREALTPVGAKEEAEDIKALANELAVKLGRAGADLRESVNLHLSARASGEEPLAALRDPETYPSQPEDLLKYLKALAGIAGEMSQLFGKNTSPGKKTLGGRLTSKEDFLWYCNDLAKDCGCTGKEAQKLFSLITGKRLHKG